MSKFSKKIAAIVEHSKEEANRLFNNFIGPEHLFLGLIRENNCKALYLLRNLNVDINQLKNGLEEVLRKHSNSELLPDADVQMTAHTSKILKMCILEARRQLLEEADTEHLLLAFMKDQKNLAAQMLEKEDIDYDKVFREYVKTIPDISSGMDYFEDDDEEEEEDDAPKGGMQSRETKTASKSGNETPVLNNFGYDITDAAMNGKLDPVVGREREVERLAQILGRRKKNNPILIGDPGVGKSAIVEGLALRIAQKKVSRILFDKRIISLDLTSVVAGTKYRGQFEERIQSIINELNKNPDVIIFIDEIHTLVGAGSAAGSMDAANILKPALARGEIQCIGATTLDEYRNSIEKDGALERRFQKILVEPTTVDETLAILKNIKEKYEDYHNVTYTDEAIEACVRLTDRYINDRYFPDKAIDALDEAGSRSHLNNISVPKSIEEQEAILEELRAKKINAVKQQNYELAASYRDDERGVIDKLSEMKKAWEAEMKENRQTVTQEEIEHVVSLMSGIPVQRMALVEGEKILKLRDSLKQKVIAQDEAVEKLSKAIMRSRVGLKDPNKPTGTFMFLGPTGVGKTYLAKELAKMMFGTSEALIRIDMSEYMEKYSVSKMVGSSPGYVGYEDGGQLTERVRRRPYSIILLDEIEKAHPEVFNLLLQVLDEGRLTDGSGRLVDFKNTVIIMTSNVGSRQLKDFGKGVGFTSSANINNPKYAESVIKKSLSKTFAPEFINRIDEIITFNPLDIDALVKIVDLEVKKLVKRIEEIGYKIDVTTEAEQFIAKEGFDSQYGARPIHRAIQTHLEDGLSELIVGNSIKIGDTITVKVSEDGEKLDFVVM